MTQPRVDRSEDGRAVWVHACPAAGPEFDEIRATLPTGGAGWQWTEDGGLTPSILCVNCGTHGFWVGGDFPRWRSC